MMTKQQKLLATGTRRPRALLLAAALLVASGSAAAQYVWIDSSGHKVYSDRSPPPSVPLKSILKAPNLAAFQRAAADADAADARDKEKAKGAPPPKAPPTLAERNADFNKRQAADQEKAKKDAEDAKQKADKQHTCDTLRDNQKLMASGTRLNTVNAAGERAYMSDAERAQKVQENQRALADCN